MSDTLRVWIFDRFLPQNLRGRDPKTHRQYGFAINDFAEFLGREPTLGDLTDEQLTALLLWLSNDRKLAPITANERVGRIRTYWNWAARKRYVEQFPTFSNLPVPERIPRAWRREQLDRLFAACREEQGYIGTVPASHWWFTIHGWWWCTAERITATLSLRFAHLDLDEGLATLPASIRKGKRKPAVYLLWPDLVEMLKAMLPPRTEPRDLVFDWPYDPTTFYNRYNRLLRRAGLPTDRDCKPHRMRVSHATWRYLAGDDPTRALGHASDATTRKHYLDPTLILRRDEKELFRPWSTARPGQATW